jgi:hypothetical protein
MSRVNRRQFGIAVLGGALTARHLDAARGSDGAVRQAGMLRSYRYVHLDVFTDTRLQGNQLFVYVDPAGLDADRMLTLTRESIRARPRRKSIPDPRSSSCR